MLQPVCRTDLSMLCALSSVPAMLVSSRTSYLSKVYNIAFRKTFYYYFVILFAVRVIEDQNTDTHLSFNGED